MFYSFYILFSIITRLNLFAISISKCATKFESIKYKIKKVVNESIFGDISANYLLDDWLQRKEKCFELFDTELSESGYVGNHRGNYLSMLMPHIHHLDNLHFFNLDGDTTLDFQTIFDVFGTRFQQPQQRMQQARMSLWITLMDVARGGSKNISIGTQHGTQAAEIEIPLGINDGDSVQYPAIGPGGMDLIVTFRIHPNPEWTRQGLDLTTERTLPIWSLILGDQLELRDILQTQLSVTVAAGTQPGNMIRLRGRGLRARSGQTGDLFVRLQASIPTPVPADILQAIQSTYGK
jgi:DnaJ-class molecular chaperone